MARKRAIEAELDDRPMEDQAASVREPGDDDEPKYEPGPNPRQWAHNNLAGVQLWERREPYESALTFTDKPPQDVIDLVKAQGFRWNSNEKAWTRAVGFQTQSQDRIVANRTYQEVVNLILKSKGLEAESGRTPF